MQILKHVFVVVLAATLVACGGGGGSSGTSTGSVSSSSGSGTSGSSTSGSGVSGVSSSPTLVISINNASGSAVTTIAVGGGFVARALVKDASGVAVSGKLVTFSLNSGLALLSPATALTDASGVAQVAISPSSVGAVGADTLLATATVNSQSVSGNTDFSVSATSLTLSAISVGSASLASGGNTTLQVTALVGGSASAFPVNVSFGASCGKINGTAGTVGATTNGSGLAAASYDAVQSDGSLCSGVVAITASSAGAAVQTKNITVAAPVANAVTFAGATPLQIFVAGSGAIEQSVAKFKVLSSAGTALAGVGVTISIVTNPGGVGLNASGSAAAVTATTNSLGEASVSVFSGTIPGPVKVRTALTSTPGVFAESQNLTVASGPPSQRFMSLSATVFNIEGQNIDGTSSVLTARIADRQGNAVEDGTVVNFVAEAGQVAVSCATSRGADGISKCSVDFQSQNPRPAGGRVSVLAFTEGTKDYTDNNFNNKYDAGDTLVNIGDAYRDDNENGVWDAGEFVVPRAGTTACTGSGEPFPGKANTCDTNLSTTVRQQLVILYSSTKPFFEVTTFDTSVLQFKLRSLDNLLLPMPSGTIVSASATGGTCAVAAVFGGLVPNVNPGLNPAADLATSHLVSLSTCASGNRIQVSITVPSGLVTNALFTIP
jgi:hypothetical protein